MLKKQNYLFVDGRYTLQAHKQSGKKFKIITIPNKMPNSILKNKQLILYKLLEKLENRDHKILINTSFNTSGEPIVFDYMDCYVSMKKMNLKYLYFDSKLYFRK